MVDTSEDVELSELNGDLYFFFVATGDFKMGKEPPKEYGRLKLHIKWK